MQPEEPADQFDARLATFGATGEVRFAVVLYGGVSLAIYMNGIAQELYSLVRATAPLGGDADQNALHVQDLCGAERAYRELACHLDGKEYLRANDGVVRTRFVVDILTGTSAGGINGVFLAKALANDQRIDTLTDLWITEGDIKKLLNDTAPYKDIGSDLKEQPPASLLSGTFMLYKLLEAVDGVSASNTRAEHLPPPAQSPPSPYADQIDLWVTTTDLSGRPEKIALSDRAQLGTEREVDHHTRFHFVYDTSDENEPINMFDRRYDPLLALAARATSSFPGAFRPVQPKDLCPVQHEYLANQPTTDRVRAWFDLQSTQAQRLFQRYGEPEYYESVSFADGGYLDNQPVDLVMETLPKRSTDTPVRRRVLLIDPDPGNNPPRHEAVNAPRANLLTTLLDVVTLPRVETIATEVARIEALAGPLHTRSEIYAAVDDALDAAAQAALAGVPENRSESMSYAGYIQLRLGDALDDLAEAIARVGFSKQAYDPDTAEYRLVRGVLTDWPPATTAADFLRDLDLAHLLRRINFVKHSLGTDHLADKQSLDAIYQQLMRKARTLRSRSSPTAGIDALRRALDELRKLSMQPEAQTDEQAAAHALALSTARAAVEAALPTVLDAFAVALALDDRARDAEGHVRAVRDDRITLRWTHFDAYDEATLALRQFIPGENEDIGVARVSPRDAQSIYCETPDHPKLAGAAVHHFGGFFDADWRRSDIMWGRLDAAERLIAVVLEGDEEHDTDEDRRNRAAARAKYTRMAQLGIISELTNDRDYVRLFKLIAPGCDKPEDGGPLLAVPKPENVLQCLAKYTPPPGPTREDVLTLATRASRVTDALVSGLPEQAGPLVQLRKWISAVLRPAAQVGELVVDRSIKSALTRHLLDLAVLAAILMIVVGPFLGGGAVVSFGWSVLAIAVGAKLLINLGRNWVRNKRWWWAAGAVVGVLAVVVGVEGLLLSTGATRWGGLLALGAAGGFLLAALGQTGKKHQGRDVNRDTGSANRGRPLVPLALAIALVAACTVVGVRQLGSHGVTKLCSQSAWEHSVIQRIGATCPGSTSSAPLPHHRGRR